MRRHIETWRPRRAGLLLGIMLILLGVLFAVGQSLRVDLANLFWPFFIIGPGLLLFVLSLSLPGRSGEAMAVLGSMAIVSGVLLLYQNTTGHWASWAYAWALVAPTSIGLGIAGHGEAKGQPERVRSGLKLAGVGAAIYVVGAIFFEFILDISGYGLGRFGLPLLLMGIGITWLVVTMRLLPRRPRGGVSNRAREDPDERSQR